MYTGNKKSPDKQDTKRMIALLKEYKTEIVKIRKEYISIDTALPIDDFSYRISNKEPKVNKKLLLRQKKCYQLMFQDFRRPLEQFARSVSQYLDHGNLAFMDEIELELRLADLEKELSFSQRLICKNL